jgi:Na+-driven multidrug efflux pump
MLNLLGSAVRGTGNMGLPAGVIVGSVIAHILISPLLIFGWGPVPTLGPAGAGWGLIIPFGAGSLVLFAYLRLAHSLVTLVFRGTPLQWRLFAEILKVDVPGLINVTITNLSVVLLTGIAGRLGREVALGYIRLWHHDGRDGRHQLGGQAVCACLSNRMDGRGNRRGGVRVDWVDRRTLSPFVDGSFYQR